LRFTNSIRLLYEGFYENVEQLVSVVDLVGVFANDPDKRCFGLRLVKLVEIRAQGRNNAFVC
jgi:hypothetical protein